MSSETLPEETSEAENAQEIEQARPCFVFEKACLSLAGHVQSSCFWCITSHCFRAGTSFMVGAPAQLIMAGSILSRLSATQALTLFCSTTSLSQLA